MEIFLHQMEQQLGRTKFPPNIRHIDTKLSRSEIEELLWTHGVHLCLSGMEGFGHYINEARAVSAMAITTNYPPMTEIITSSETGVLVDPTNMLQWTNSLPFANVGPAEIVQVMNKVVLPMSLQERAAKGQRARVAFEHDQRQFQQRADQLQCYIINNCRLQNGDTSTTTTTEGLRKCVEKCGLVLE